ncbi:hypothetical protein VMT65_05590 [Nocardia sp. CDC153]|uniref:hypothetical protein n=1 Tax=unclassified Nocardia TaxID=2637762 RepID=UPI002DB83019|nr:MULTISPECIES: hypothetical protein [unclassified Nocardia]MEC3916355.1 hypothetical protein [Nocardia sp. CDC160]MEC3952500.1 hypothetical protein [Nocardia sp. CDC153]
MKIALGTAGLIAAGLFLAAPNASADALQLQPIDVGITGSGIGAGSAAGGCISGVGTELGLGSVGVGSSTGGPFLDLGSVCVPLG